MVVTLFINLSLCLYVIWGAYFSWREMKPVTLWGMMSTMTIGALCGTLLWAMFGVLDLMTEWKNRR